MLISVLLFPLFIILHSNQMKDSTVSNFLVTDTYNSILHATFYRWNPVQWRFFPREIASSISWRWRWMAPWIKMKRVYCSCLIYHVLVTIRTGRHQFIIQKKKTLLFHSSCVKTIFSKRKEKRKRTQTWRKNDWRPPSTHYIQFSTGN